MTASSNFIWDSSPTPAQPNTTQPPQKKPAADASHFQWNAAPKSNDHFEWDNSTPLGTASVDRAQQWAQRYKPAIVPTPVEGLRPFIDFWSEKYNIPKAESYALAGIESSGGRNLSASPTGAIGVYQIEPDTAKGFGYSATDMLDPEKNIQLGLRYYARLKKVFGGDPYKAAMAYNMGQYGLREKWDTPDEIPQETQQYAAKFYAALHDPNFAPVQSVTHPTMRKGVQQAVHGVPQETADQYHEIEAGGADKALSSVGGVLNEGYKSALEIQNEAAGDALMGVSAITGAPQRAVQGTLHGGLGEGTYSVFHPNDTTTQQAEIDHLMDMAHLPKGAELAKNLTDFAADYAAAAKGEPGGGKFDMMNIAAQVLKAHPEIASFFEEQAVQTGTDPLTYLPIIGWLGKGIKYGAEGLEALNTLERMTKGTEAEKAFQEMAQTGRTTMTANVQHMLRVGKRDAKAGKQALFGRRPEQDPFLGHTPEGKQMRLSVEKRQRTFEQQANAQDEQSLAPYAEQMKSARKFSDMPPEAQELVRRRTQFEAWSRGTDKMRADALADGFQPTHEELATFPTPTHELNYNYKNDYITMIQPKKVGSKWGDTPVLKSVGGQHKAEFSGFEKGRSAEGEIPTNQYDLWTNRFKIGNALVRQRGTDAETLQRLGENADFQTAAYKKMFGLGDDTEISPEHQAKIDLLQRTGGGWWNPAEGPIDVTKLSHTPIRGSLGSMVAAAGTASGSRGLQHVGQGIEKVSNVLRFSGGAQKGAISLNPLPHEFRNVGEVNYIHGGAQAMGKAISHAVSGISEPQMTRLVDLGLDANYVKEIEGPLGAVAQAMKVAGHKPLEIWHTISTKLMNRMEIGYRQSLLDKLDKDWGTSSLNKDDPDFNPNKEYKKAAYIQKALGDYRNNSLFVDFLNSIGGSFLAFRLGIVPESVGSAIFGKDAIMSGKAGRVAQITRMNEESRKQFGYDLGGPVEDYGKLALSGPGGTGKYLTSPASIGIPGNLAYRGATNTLPKSGGELRDLLLSAYVPQYGTAEDAGLTSGLGGGYGAESGADPLTTALWGILTGGYPYNPPSWRAERKYDRSVERAP